MLKYLKNKKILITFLVATSTVFVLFLIYSNRNVDKSKDTVPIYTIKKEDENAEVEPGEDNNQKNNEEDAEDGKNTKNNTLTYTEYQKMMVDVKSLSESTRRFHSSYPWFSKLPIENDFYIVTWDLVNENFRIGLKTKQDSLQELKERLTEKALQDIYELAGFYPSKYEYYIVFLQ